MAYRELRKSLLTKLNISPQALSQRCNKIQSNVPMSTRDAIYIIAQQNGIRLDKYLDDETIHRIRGLLTQVTTPPQISTPKKVIKNRLREPRQYIIRIGKEFNLIDPILTRVKLNEADEMSRIFPYLYLLENSIREFIDKIMTTKYGKNWWNPQAPKELRNDVSKRMSDDQKYSWHQRRGARPIDYLDLKDLPRLMNKIEDIVVPDIISDLEWFRQLVNEVYKSRCVVCHMNPLDKNNINAVIVKFNQWQKQIDAKKDLIFKLVSKQ
jgi:predicted restriction endonuclease